MDNNGMFENEGKFTGAQEQPGEASNRVYGDPGQGYQQPGGVPTGNQPYQYQQQGGYERELEEPVSMGEWLVTLLLITFVPCVNIVLMFIWAFSSKEKKSKSNYFKAQLILTGIMIVVYIIFIIVFGVYIASAFDGLYGY